MTLTPKKIWDYLQGALPAGRVLRFIKNGEFIYICKVDTGEFYWEHINIKWPKEFLEVGHVERWMTREGVSDPVLLCNPPVNEELLWD